MEKSHYTKIKHYVYYALILHEDDKYVYVGKTTEKRLSNTFSRHVCGRVAATNAFFDKESRPKLYLLEECDETTAQGYKRVVAYVHMFLSEGYCCINHAGTIKHAKNPKEDTKRLIMQLKSKPMDEILMNTYVEKTSNSRVVAGKEQAAANGNTAPKKHHGEQLNIRTDHATKERFMEFCSQMGVNQRQGFELLLDHEKEVEQTNALQILTEYQNKMKKLEKENEDLRIKYRKLQKEQTPTSELWARSYVEFLKNGISFYLNAILKPAAKWPPLKRYSYNAYRDRYLNGQTCSYPEQEGFFVATLEAVLWSNSGTKACFLIWKDLNGVQRKLRYYPKKHYMGRSFLDDLYAFEGARWILGALRAKDGAMELVAGLPLIQVEKTVEKKNSKKSSLADRIALIERGKRR